MAYKLLKKEDSFLTVTIDSIKYLDLEEPNKDNFMNNDVSDSLDTEVSKIDLYMNDLKEEENGKIVYRNASFDYLDTIELDNTMPIVETADNFYTYDNGWVEVLADKTRGDLIKSDFENNQIIDIDLITKESWDELGEFDIVAWTDIEDPRLIINLTELFTVTDYFDNNLRLRVYSELDLTTANVSAVPYPQIIVANGDMYFGNFIYIDDLNLEYVTEGEGLIKIATSIDGGNTFRDYNDNIVDINSVEDMRTNGMTPTEFEGKFSGYSIENIDGMRNAYLIEIQDTTDTSQMTELNATLTIIGEMVKQMDNTNIEMTVYNSTLEVTYKTAGNYVFNIIY